MSTPRYHIRIDGDDVIFSAAHFLTFGPEVCERLHGHNYRVAAEFQGPLDENQYVVDFQVVREVLMMIVADLDHRVLLPSEHPQMRVASAAKEMEVTFADRRWVFPRGDCQLLPLANTTAELLARHIGQRLSEEIRARIGIVAERLRIEVEEMPGARAVCELS